MNIAAAERAKYERVWRIPNYGKFSPGERLVDAFLEIVQPEPGCTIVDFGCGGGKATRALQKRGFDVIAVDHTRAGITPHRWKHIRPHFIESCLWRRTFLADAYLRYGYCTDVMEHIPTEFTMLTIQNMMDHVRECFFQIATLPDEFGKAIGEPLHLTVRPFAWWRDHLSEFGEILDARDLMHAGLFHVRA